MLQLDQAVMGITTMSATVQRDITMIMAVYQRQSVSLSSLSSCSCMISKEFTLTLPIVKEYLRAVVSLFRALKKCLLALTTGIYNWEKWCSMWEIDNKKIKMRYKVSKSHTLDLYQNKQWFAVRQEGISFLNFQFIAVSNMMRQVFLRSPFYLEMADKMRQVEF